MAELDAALSGAPSDESRADLDLMHATLTAAEFDHVLAFDWAQATSKIILADPILYKAMVALSTGGDLSKLSVTFAPAEGVQPRTLQPRDNCASPSCPVCEGALDRALGVFGAALQRHGLHAIAAAFACTEMGGAIAALEVTAGASLPVAIAAGTVCVAVLKTLVADVKDLYNAEGQVVCPQSTTPQTDAALGLLRSCLDQDRYCAYKSGSSGPALIYDASLQECAACALQVQGGHATSCGAADTSSVTTNVFFGVRHEDGTVTREATPAVCTQRDGCKPELGFACSCGGGISVAQAADCSAFGAGGGRTCRDSICAACGH